MKNILIVDDERNFLLSLSDMFETCEEQFKIQTAGNGKEAAEILDQEAIDLVVTDLKMPELDGFGLLAHMSKTTPDIPVIAMTAFGTPDMEDQLLNMGAFQYIEKPIEFDTLVAKIKEGLDAGTKGHVAGISIGSFLQLLDLERKTCTLTVHADDKVGTLFFNQGDLINAVTEGCEEGLEAAMEIIGWERTKIEILNMCRKRKRLIEVPLGFILIESARAKDEKSHPAEDAEREAGTPIDQDAGTGQPVHETMSFEELDFDTSPSAPPPNVTPINLEEVEDLVPASPPTAADAEEATFSMEVLNDEPNLNSVETVAQLHAAAGQLPGIKKIISLTNDGTLLSSESPEDKELGAFVHMLSTMAEDLSRQLPFKGLAHVVLNQKNGDKLAILGGPEIITAVEIATGAAHQEIIDSLRPAVGKISI